MLSRRMARGQASGRDARAADEGLAAGLGMPDWIEHPGLGSRESLALRTTHPVPHLAMMYQKQKEFIV